jgi:hypothetical protein
MADEKGTPVAQVQAAGRCGPAGGDRHLPYQLHRLPPGTGRAEPKSGPQTCGGCHQEDPAVASTWKDLAFDKSLHYRHVKANAEKCESCHHANTTSRPSDWFTPRVQEGACVYCHTDTAQENTPTRKEASHYQCIGCHRDNLAKNKQGGPISCVGCHDADFQMGIEVVQDDTPDEAQPTGRRLG